MVQNRPSILTHVPEFDVELRVIVVFAVDVYLARRGNGEWSAPHIST